MTRRDRMTMELLLKGYRLATAEIFYRRPDHPSLLQSYIWQDLDIAPQFPVLRRFLDFWQRSLDGPLHAVRVSSSSLMRPVEFKAANGVFRLH